MWQVLLGFIILSIISFFIFITILYLTSGVNNKFVTKVLFTILIVLVTSISYKIYIDNDKTLEMCKMRCPYYNKWSSKERYDAYMECADVCEHGQNIFAPKKRKKN